MDMRAKRGWKLISVYSPFCAILISSPTSQTIMFSAPLKSVKYLYLRSPINIIVYFSNCYKDLQYNC